MHIGRSYGVSTCDMKGLYLRVAHLYIAKKMRCVTCYEDGHLWNA